MVKLTKDDLKWELENYIPNDVSEYIYLTDHNITIRKELLTDNQSKSNLYYLCLFSGDNSIDLFDISEKKILDLINIFINPLIEMNKIIS